MGVTDLAWERGVCVWGGGAAFVFPCILHCLWSWFSMVGRLCCCWLFAGCRSQPLQHARVQGRRRVSGGPHCVRCHWSIRGPHCGNHVRRCVCDGLCTCCLHLHCVIYKPATQCVVVPVPLCSSCTVSCHSVRFTRAHDRESVMPSLFPRVLVSDRALRVVRGDYSPILARVVESLTAAIEFGAYPVNGTCPFPCSPILRPHNMSFTGTGAVRGWGVGRVGTHRPVCASTWAMGRSGWLSAWSERAMELGRVAY